MLWLSEWIELLNGAARAEEMLLNRCFFDIQAAEEKIRWAIENCNTLRPHGNGSPVRL